MARAARGFLEVARSLAETRKIPMKDHRALKQRFAITFSSTETSAQLRGQNQTTNSLQGRQKSSRIAYLNALDVSAAFFVVFLISFSPRSAREYKERNKTMKCAEARKIQIMFDKGTEALFKRWAAEDGYESEETFEHLIRCLFSTSSEVPRDPAEGGPSPKESSPLGGKAERTRVSDILESPTLLADPIPSSKEEYQFSNCLRDRMIDMIRMGVERSKPWNEELQTNQIQSECGTVFLRTDSSKKPSSILFYLDHEDAHKIREFFNLTPWYPTPTSARTSHLYHQ
ncbi:uncharacterized protein PAC_05597 [Phialocephala subalpina]|uniref:Uncharacterized protein n=1 Tax=Phialocephala subalpina TaxID=576137 RepID=A0A1L7WSG0_9HELO|nr:uncharacterized protein PAC_05597 [Phialocephala subalpina]